LGVLRSLLCRFLCVVDLIGELFWGVVFSSFHSFGFGGLGWGKG
jgi:hypothetical protein